jgi:hypothetical protein
VSLADFNCSTLWRALFISESTKQIAYFQQLADILDISDLALALFLDIVYKSPMNRIDFKETLKNAKAELAELQHEMGLCLQRQEELEKKIAAIRQMIMGFSAALGEQFVEEDSLGLTDAIRQAFKTHEAPLTPTDVRGRLEALGYDTSKYGNMMASVHTIINRLVTQGQIRQNGTIAGKPAYQWIQQPIANALAARLAEAETKKK